MQPWMAKRSACLLAVSLLLSSCSDMDRAYRLRYWEMCRLLAEKEMRKHHYREARRMAEEAIHQAYGFGESDFRLGVSLNQLGDILTASEKYKAAEETYLKAIKILQASEDKEAAEEDGYNKANRKKEKDLSELNRRLVRQDRANCLAHLAGLYVLQDRFAEASDCFDKASNIYQSMVGGNQWSVDDSPLGQQLVQCLVGLARADVSLKNFDAADKTFKRALEMAAASNCPEFTLRDIRDEYLKLLQQLGKNDQAKQLVADTLFSKLSLDGLVAMKKDDDATAESCFRQAYMYAQQSIFSQRRLMRALFNLQTIFAKETKYSEMEHTFDLACQFMQWRGLRFDRDFDVMLTGQAQRDLITNKPEHAIQLMNQQYSFRFMQYGPESVEALETLAIKGEAEWHAGKRAEAERTANVLYDVLQKKYSSNRRAGNAMKDTATLLADLNRLDQWETVSKWLLASKLKVLEPTNPYIIGYKTSMFVNYFRFRMHDKAVAMVNDIVDSLKKHGNSVQKVAAMPYLVLIQSCALAADWYDIAENATVLGQSILQNEMAGVAMDKMNQDNWTKDLAKLEAHAGHKF